MNSANTLAEFTLIWLAIQDYFAYIDNMIIPRTILSSIRAKLDSKKIILVYGARQVGKTTLIKMLLDELPTVKALCINADEKKYSDVFSSRDLQKMRLLVDGYELLFIDEAQRIPDIGINLKILHDALPDLKIIVTGSSSLDLASKTREPLTGRVWTFTLYPIAISELLHISNQFDIDQNLSQYLIYGFYPETLTFMNTKDKYQYLQELSSSYLYKDILEMGSIKHHSKLHDLLRLLAFQIGSQVSFSELGNALSMSKDTVMSYIDLLEKSFVIFRLSGFSRNLRKEVSKMSKIYFYDLGIRNILIDNLNSLDFRDDIGKLWENFLMIERKKLLSYRRSFANTYFWRTYTGAELDLVEERAGQLFGYEFKYKPKKIKVPKTWKETYPDATCFQVNRNNYFSFLTEEM